MQLIKGANLTATQRREVLSAFVHRHLAIGTGKAYATEAQWIAEHAFYFTRAGRLAQRPAYCEPHYLAD